MKINCEKINHQLFLLIEFTFSLFLQLYLYTHYHTIYTIRMYSHSLHLLLPRKYPNEVEIAIRTRLKAHDFIAAALAFLSATYFVYLALLPLERVAGYLASFLANFSVIHTGKVWRLCFARYPRRMQISPGNNVAS